jgi:hypothetical protein
VNMRTREELLAFLATLRDEMMTPMSPFQRSKWVSERAWSITDVLSQETADSKAIKAREER